MSTLHFTMSENAKNLWGKVLLELEKEVSRANFLALFRQTTLDSLENGTATISAPSLMIIDMIQKRFSATIQQELLKNTGKSIKLVFAVKKHSGDLKAKDELELTPLFAQTPTPSPLIVGHLPRVRPDFTFETLAVSGSNQLAFVSSQTVATHPGRSYNPFFIYGPVGVGKTHLMHAIANEVYKKQPDKKIIYITSEEFTNEVVEAIRGNETAKMKRRFRSALLLLIDDIQFIEGKMVVQEELFHTFNILIDQGSQIVLSSDRPPEEIKRLEKRLSSRFAGGLTVDIEPPDFELKTAILLIKARKFGADLPIETAKFLADCAQDARTLEGLLLRLITEATSKNKELLLDLAKEIVGKKEKDDRGHIHAEDVIKIVCEFYSLKPTQLRSPRRNAQLVRARQIAMYILYEKLQLTFVEIGNLLGGRDHTTIMHGVDKIKQIVDSKAILNKDIMGIINRLYV